jgi:RNA-splicing ligase RtcB
VVGLAEEAPIAYKEADQAIGTVEKVRLAGKAAGLKPLAVVKG